MKKKEKSFSVLIIDNYHYDHEDDYVIDGLPTKEIAIEFARRWVRQSLEEFRNKAKDKDDMRNLWRTFGEDALAINCGYRGSSELDFFIENPATKREDTDWTEFRKIEAIEKELEKKENKKN